MTEVSDTAERGKGPRWAVLAGVVAVIALVAAGAVLYAKHGGASQTAAAPPGIAHEGRFARYATGSLVKLQTWKAPRAAPAIRFNDRDGKPADLSKFRGQIVVLNIWATWCAPCRVEMPTLATLQKRYPLAHLQVVPVSVDRASDLADAKSFIDVHDPLPLYNDPGFTAPAAFKLHGLPSTVILDTQGREIARLEGEAKWDTPEAYALFDKLIEGK